MSDEEAKARISSMLESRFKEGFDRMRSMERCRQIYADMKKQGYRNEAEDFKVAVIMATVEHPEWSEQDILEAIAAAIDLSNESYA